jgi:hypothetical protein
MSIWSSEQGGDVLAVDLHDDETDEYKAVGPARLVIDVATATSWNDRIRLAIFENSGTSMDVCVALDRDAAGMLRDHLIAALARL